MKSQLIVLMSYLVMFGLVTIIGIVDLFRNIQIVDIGLPVGLTNLFIVLLGVAGIIKTVVYLIFYEKKIN